MSRSYRSKVDQLVTLTSARLLARIRPRWGTVLSVAYYKRNGLRFNGKVNYISTASWFDGTDYSLIELGAEVTISSEVSFLTHDWALHTIGKSLGVHTEEPLGRIEGITIGDYCFIGRGAILMPGTRLGKACVVGAGSVVRGDFDDYSLIVGNPATAVTRTDTYFRKKVDGSIAVPPDPDSDDELPSLPSPQG